MTRGARWLAAAWAGLLVPAAPLQAQTPVIEHDKLECVPVGMRAKVTACVDRPEAVLSARLLFRAAGETDWQMVPMRRDERCFNAALPSPRSGVASLSYLIEMTDPTMTVVRTVEHRAPVRARSACAVAATFSGPEPERVGSRAPQKGGGKSPVVLAVVGGGVAAAGAAVALTRSSQEPASTTVPSTTPAPPSTAPPTTAPPPPPTTRPPATTTTTTPPPPNTTEPPPPTTQPPATTTTTLPPSTTTTTVPPTTTTTTSTTTTTTTTTMPASCTFTASPDRTFAPFPGASECTITTNRSNCSWRIRVEPGGADWLVIDGDDRGTGTGSVRYHFGANSGRSRTARIEVRDHDTSCTITQAGVLPDAAPAGTAWTSHLDVSGARAEVIVDGVAVAVQERGVFLGRTGAQGVHRVEARLVQAAGRPGLWRFEIGGGAPAGLRPLEGNVVQVSEGVVTFRLEGRPGERVAFTWRSR